MKSVQKVLKKLPMADLLADGLLRPTSAVCTGRTRVRDSVKSDQGPLDRCAYVTARGAGGLMPSPAAIRRILRGAAAPTNALKGSGFGPGPLATFARCASQHCG